MNTEKKSTFSRTIVLIAIALFCALSIIGLFKFGSILAFIMVYPWIFSKVSGVVINQFLSQLIALPVAIILVWTVSKLIFSFKRRTVEIIALL